MATIKDVKIADGPGPAVLIDADYDVTIDGLEIENCAAGVIVDRVATLKADNVTWTSPSTPAAEEVTQRRSSKVSKGWSSNYKLPGK